MARPKKEINWDLIEAKMEAGCTAKEIYNSKSTSMCEDTFYSRFYEEFGTSFKDYSGNASEIGIGDLKLICHIIAKKGNVNALMFLLKCRAGMREPEITNNMAANQTQIDQSHKIMELEHQLEELKERLNGNKPQAE